MLKKEIKHVPKFDRSGDTKCYCYLRSIDRAHEASSILYSILKSALRLSVTFIFQALLNFELEQKYIAYFG